MGYTKIIAVDFDGTLVENKFPRVGDPIWDNIEAIKKEKKAGAAVILWTCRVGRRLTDAVRTCDLYGIELDAVNENLPDVIRNVGCDTRKVIAHEYWDDLAVRM